MPIRWLAGYDAPTTSLKYSFEVTLGKMLQPRAVDDTDIKVEYINSAAVQWRGVKTEPDKTMWASPPEVHDLSVKNGDLLICEGGDVGRSAIYDGPLGRIFQNSVHRVRGDQGSDSRYLKYLLFSLYHSGWLEVLCNKATIAHLTVEKLGNLEIPLVSIDDQHRIADFLDAETAQIDALAANRDAQVSMLGELELARIGKQLSGDEINIDRKKTDWSWLPSIPSTWSVGPVYAYFDIQLGKMLNAERASGGNQQPYLRNANVHWYEIDTSDLATMTFGPEERIRYSVRAGDLLVCEGGAGVAEAGIWNGEVSTCFYQKSLHRARATGSVPPEWLMYWLRYAKAAGVFQADGNIATIPHLTGEQLAEYRIPIPADGQSRVAELLADIAAINRARRTIALAKSVLAERRLALITAAVTGQIDVTTAGSPVAAGGAVG